MLQIPDRSLINFRGCPKSTMKDIASGGYRATKAKKKGHLYLTCKHGSRSRRKRGMKQKVSCVAKECGPDVDWCWVPKHCGSRSNPCRPIDKADPLKCKAPKKRRRRKEEEEESTGGG